MDSSCKETKTRDNALGFAIYLDYRGREDGHELFNTADHG